MKDTGLKNKEETCLKQYRAQNLEKLLGNKILKFNNTVTLNYSGILIKYFYYLLTSSKFGHFPIDRF